MQQAVGADADMLRNPDKTRDTAWEQPSLNPAEGFPVNFDQFGQTLLSQTGLKPRPLDIFADTSKNLTFIHQRLENIFQNYLLPHIISAKTPSFLGAGRKGLPAE